MIKLEKFGFRAILSNANLFYTELRNNRSRLSPWFFWADKKVTPNFSKFMLFMTLLILDTKRKKLMSYFSDSKLYDEHFLIFQDYKFSGMIGLDNIDNIKREAEIWVLVTLENEGKGVVTESLKLIENYSFNDKNLDSVYAKTATGNIKAENLLKRNNYEISKIDFDVPTSKRNPEITNLMTWSKQR